jgi:hypothetical protein
MKIPQNLALLDCDDLSFPLPSPAKQRWGRGKNGGGVRSFEPPGAKPLAVIRILAKAKFE